MASKVVREPNRRSNAAETIGMTSPPTPVPENMLLVKFDRG